MILVNVVGGFAFKFQTFINLLLQIASSWIVNIPVYDRLINANIN